MKAEFVQVIEVRDNKFKKFLTFEVTNNGIKGLILNLNLAEISYNTNPTFEKLMRIISLIEVYNNIFDKYRISYLVKDEPGETTLKDFFQSIKDKSKTIHDVSLDYNNKVGQSFSYNLLVNSNYSDTSYYNIVDVQDEKDMDFQNLVMYLKTPVFDQDDEDEIDYDYFDEEDEFDDIDELYEDEMQPDSYIYEEIYQFPVHIGMLEHIKSKLLMIDDSQELLQFILYCEFYMQYVTDNSLRGKYLQTAIDINNIIVEKEKMLIKINPNYESLSEYYKNNSDFRLIKEPSIYNDNEIFVSTILDSFLQKNDIYFFLDLKSLFQRYDVYDDDACMFAARDFSIILEKYKMNREIKCLKHIATEKNVSELMKDMFAYFDLLVKSASNEKFFGKHFGDDLDDFSRGLD